MASIDPTEEAEDGDDKPFVTLKIIRDPLDVLDDEDDEDDEMDEDDVEAIRRRLGFTDSDDSEEDEEDEDDDDEDEDEEMVNGGPSDPDRVRKAHEAAFKKSLKEDDDLDLDEVLVNGINGKFDKGKGRALGLEDDESDESIDLENSSFVVCTLDATKVCDQGQFGIR
jgi:FK506-binding nuclear protein